MKRGLFWVARLLLLAVWIGLSPSALADIYSFCDAIPEAIERNVLGLEDGCTIEDYIEIPTPDQALGIVLLRNRAGVRRLCVFEDAQGEPSLLLQTESAVPQGEGTAFMVRAHTDNEVQFLNAPDELGFNVVYIRPGEEGYWDRTVEYHWQDGAFHLIRFSHLARYFVLEDGLWRYEDMNGGKRGGPFALQLPTELREVDVNNLPQTPRELGALALPDEVYDHIASRFADYAVEGYIELTGAPEGDYGFALLHRGGERVLTGYRREDGQMTCYLESRGAVPQGETEGAFSVCPRGETYTVWTEAGAQSLVSDGLEFSVITLDEIGEAYDGIVHYQWQDGTFRLTEYTDAIVDTVLLREGELRFDSISVGYMGKLKGEVETDIRLVDFGALPKTIGEAWKMLGGAPEMAGVFSAQVVPFEKGRKYPVYTGPGKRYLRAGNGKASVSTNDWIEVFGRTGNWIMILYAVNEERCRVGWIEASALPRGVQVKEMDSAFAAAREDEGTLLTLGEDCELTDDPFISGTAVASLPNGTAVRLLMSDDIWAYVRVETEEGTMLGFVPVYCLGNG